MANKPTNPALYARVKSEAKSKFDTWPSAYGSAWLVKTYKKRGGGYRKAQDGMEIPGYDFMNYGGMLENRIQRLENREANLVARGNRAVDEGRERRADRLLGRAARVENRLIKAKESASKKNMMDVGSVEWAPDPLFHNSMGGMMYGDYTFPMMDDGGEMALGQIAAVTDKMSKLQQFLNPNSDVEPWVASKLAVMDDSAGAIYDYMMYNPEAQEQPEMEEMREGGIPSRYKNMGFNKVGVKKQSNRPGKKWMVLAKKDDKYKVVHGGYKGMKDFTQHRNENRRDRFWNRMGGRNSAKATDPFSPLYWHKRFGTWAEGGEPQNAGFQALPQEVQAKIMANMMYGGYLPEAAAGAAIMPIIQAVAPAVIGALSKNKQSAPQASTQAPINIYNVSPQQSETSQNPYNMKRPGQNVYDYAMGGMPCYECGGQMKYKKGGIPFIAMAYFEDGGIKIDPAKKGTFKAQATQEGGPMMGPMLPDQQLASDFSKWYDLNNPFDNKDISYITQGRRGQPMDEDMYRLKQNASNVMEDVVDEGKDFLRNRYADYSTPMQGFRSAANTVGDLVSLGSWLGKRNKENTAKVENSRRSFSDNLFPTMPSGITGERGNFDAFGNFRPDETLASRTYFSQMGGEIEMTDDQIRQLVALGAEIEILD